MSSPSEYMLVLPTTQGQTGQVVGLIDSMGDLSWITTLTNTLSMALLSTRTFCDVPLTLIIRDITGSVIAPTLTLTGNSLINYGTSACSVGSGFVFAPTNQNTIVGLNAGNNNSLTGVTNAALGYYALSSVANGSNSVAVGSSALSTLANNSQMTALGFNALKANTAGSTNTAIGTNALLAIVGTTNNTAIGFNTKGMGGSVSNTMVGNNTKGSVNESVSIGNNIFMADTAGYYSIVIGNNALTNNTAGANNVAVGSAALQANTAGEHSVAIGVNALAKNAIGPAVSDANNVAIGYYALAAASGTTGVKDSVAIGAFALANIIGSFPNIVIGANSGSNYTGGQANNILIGDSGQSTDQAVCRIDHIFTALLQTGSFVTVNSLNQLGFNNSPTLLFTATSCQVAGTLVMRSTTGSFVATTITLTGNSLINYGTSSCSTGSGFIFAPTNQNTLIGLNAGRNGLLTGTANSAYGVNTLLALTTGLLNTAFGASTLATVTAGSSNISVGANSGSNYTDSESNNILIGNAGVAGDENTIRIGLNSLTTHSCFIAGISGNTPPGSTSFVVINSANQLGAGTIATLTISNLTVDTQNGALIATSGSYTSTIGTDGTRLASFPLTSSTPVTFFQPISPSRESYFFDDFLAFDATTSAYEFYGDTPWIAGNNNFITTVTSTNTAIGITRLMTGTTQNFLIKQTNGTVSQSMRFGLGSCLNEWSISLPALATVSNNFTINVGIGDNPEGTPNNGVYFSYNNSSANWVINTASGGSTSQLATGVGPSANTFQRLKFQVNGTGTNVNFFIDDVAVGSLSTNIPVNNSSSPFVAIIDDAGNGGAIDTDYWYFHYIFNTQR